MNLIQIIFFIFFSALFFRLNSQDNSKPVIFINPIIAKQNTGIDGRFAENLSKQFFSKMYETYESKYEVNDQSAIKALNKQAAELLKKNCDASKCMAEIAENLQAAFTVYGELDVGSTQDGGFELKINTIVRDSNGNQKTKTAFVSFYEFQKDYFIDELVKKSIRPDYKINISSAPKTPQLQIQSSTFNFQPIKTGQLVDLKNFEVSDQDLQGRLIRFKEVLQQGQDFQKNGKIKDALESYQRVYRAIKKWSKEEQKKVTSFIKNVETLYSVTYNEVYINNLNEISDAIKGKESDKRALEIALNRMESLEAEYLKPRTEPTDYPDNTINKDLEKSFSERSEQIQLQIYRLRESEADQAYYNQDFNRAIKTYELLKNEVSLNRGISFKSNWDALEKNIQIKITQTQKNAQIYIKSEVGKFIDRGKRKYDDWGLEGQSNLKLRHAEEVNRTFKQAYDILLNYGTQFKSQETVRYYNSSASIIIKDNDFPEDLKPRLIEDFESEIAFNERKKLEEKRNLENEKQELEYQDELRKSNYNAGIYLNMIWPGSGQSIFRKTSYPWITFGLSSWVLIQWSEYNTAESRYNDNKDSNTIFLYFFRNSSFGSSDSALNILLQNRSTELGNEYERSADRLVTAGSIYSLWWTYCMIDYFFFTKTGILENAKNDAVPLNFYITREAIGNQSLVYPNWETKAKIYYQEWIEW